MNSYLAAAVLLIVAGVVHAETDFVKLKEYFNECAESTKATETYESVIEKKILPTSDNGMCLVKCLMEKQEIYNADGTYNPEGTKVYLKKKYEGNDEKFKKAVTIVENCSKIDVTGLDKCEAAVKHASCAKANGAKEKLDLKD